MKSRSSSQESWKCNKCGFVVFVLPNRPLRLCPKCGTSITQSATETEITHKIQPSQAAKIELKDNLVHASNDEIDFIKKEGGTRSYVIRNSEKIGTFSEKTIYRFDFDGDRIETDVPVLLQIGESKERIEAEKVTGRYCLDKHVPKYLIRVSFRRLQSKRIWSREQLGSDPRIYAN